MIKWFGKWSRRLLVLLTALVFVQAPQFISQYQDHLRGHVKELDVQIGMLKKIASLSGKNIDQYVDKFVKSSDPDFSQQGMFLERMLERYEKLSASMLSFKTSSRWMLPFSYMANFDMDISQETFNSFTIGFPLNLEGIIYALIGALVGYGLVSAFLGLYYGMKEKRRERKAAKETTVFVEDKKQD